jgi:hypothetical protein
MVKYIKKILLEVKEMDNENLLKKIKHLEETIEHLQFKQDLLFNNSSVDRYLYEFNITKMQYNKIMNLFDIYRNQIDQKQPVSHTKFEEDVYAIFDSIDKATGIQNDYINNYNNIKYNYHFVEGLARSFWEENRWEEVFMELYGKMPKYKYLEKDK